MKQMLDFLTALEENNNRDWFHDHQTAYKAAKLEFETLVRDLTLALREFDSSIPLLEPKELTFKLMRDTRFSHDKSPYHPAFRAHISSKGKLPVPVGYYVMLRPGGRSFLGGGLFADMFRDATDLVRRAIAAQGDEWQRILADPAFAARFSVKGTALKNVPKEFDPAHPQAEYLKYKSWFLEYAVSDEQLLQPDFIPYAAGIFRTMCPFNAFLNEALAGFSMPSR